MERIIEDGKCDSLTKLMFLNQHEARVFKIFFHVFIIPFIKLKNSEKIKLLQHLRSRKKAVLAQEYFNKSFLGVFYRNYVYSGNTSTEYFFESSITKRNYIKDLIWFLKAFFFRSVVSPGYGAGVFQKFFYRMFFASSNGIKLDYSNNHFLRKSISSKIDGLFSTVDSELISFLIPAEYIEAKSNKNNKLKFIKSFKGSIYSLMESPAVISLFSEKAKIHGTQHGGVYGEWKTNLFEQLEVNCCDSFRWWRGTYIDRYYSFYPRLIREKKPINKIIWYGRGVLNEYIYSKVIPEYNAYIHGVNYVDEIKNALNEIEEDYYINLHPMMSKEKAVSLYGNIPSVSERGQKFNNNGGVLAVFDVLSQSLYYQCLKLKLPFVIISPLPEGITEKYMEELMILKDLGIYIDVKNDIANKIKYVISNWSSISKSHKMKRIYSNYENFK